MYSGVPTTKPVFVTFCASLELALAIPKSTTFTRSEPSRDLVTMMLSGFRSRCTIPASCATCSASAVWCTMLAARAGVSKPSASIKSLRAFPSMNSIAR